MSRADLRFLLKVIALVLLVIAGGVIAFVKLTGGPDPVVVDCEALAERSSGGAVYSRLEAVLERSTAEHVKWCQLSGAGPEGVRDLVTVTVERFEDKAPSTLDECFAPVEVAGGGSGCLDFVDGAGTPGSNGATVLMVLADGDLRVELEARMSAPTLRQAEQLAAGAGQGVEAFVLADLARFTEAAAALTGTG